MSIKRVSVVKKRDYPEIRDIEESFQISDCGEICFAIGGDGTFLTAARKFDCPILHIRSGEKNSLGFRADVALSNIKEVIGDLKQGKYIIERYAKLRIAHRNKIYDAVNDVVLFRAGSRAINFRVSYYDYEGKKLPLYPGEVRGDGIVFTRQIGSTAYNYFIQGPILFDLDAAVTKPISANHSFSIVSNRDFEVKMTKRVGVLEYDGINVAKLRRGETFTVTKSDKVIKVVRLKRGEKFSEKLARLERF